MRAIPEGTYVLIGHDLFGAGGGRWWGSLPTFFTLMVLTPFVRQLPRLRFSTPSKTDLMAVLRDLLESGKLTPVVGRTFRLAEVPDAIRCLAQGDVRGRIVITV